MEHLATIKLRNNYEIYKDKDNFIIESPIGKTGEVSKSVIKGDKIEIFLTIFQGKKASINEALKIIGKQGYGKYLHTYGWKQRFEVEKILLCLVAAVHGRVEKKDKEYIFYF